MPLKASYTSSIRPHTLASIVFTYSASAEEELLEIAALTLLHYCAQGVMGYFEDIEELTHTHTHTPVQKES